MMEARGVTRGSAGKSTVGKRIREVREARGMTLHQLGRAVGLTWQQVQRIETGVSQLNIPRLTTFAQALGVPVSELLTEGPETVDVTPEHYFRNMGMTEEEVRNVLEYADFLLKRHRRGGNEQKE